MAAAEDAAAGCPPCGSVGTAGEGRRARSLALERRAGTPAAALRGCQVLGWTLQRFLGRGGSQEELTHFPLGARQIVADVCGGGRHC